MTGSHRWPLGVSALGLPGGSIAELVALATRYGCTTLELRAADGEAVSLGMDAAARAAARRACEEAGLAVAALGTYVKVCAEQPVGEEIEAHLRLAADLGAAGIRLFPGGDGTAAADERAVRRLAAAAPLATQLGVRLLVETHDSHPRGADVAGLLGHPDLAGAPVGAIWDLVHPWVAGEDPADTWAALSPFAGHVQVKDVVERRPGATPALTGTGVLPLPEMLAVLEQGGYAGPLVLEWEKPWHPTIPDLEAALRTAADFLAR